MSGALRTLIVDDEPLARARLLRLLHAERDFEVVGEAEDGLSALAAIRDLGPELVLLDVQMPEMSGLDVAASLDAEDAPAIVFVTAHDHFALQAFDAHAIDYVLKPVDPARLRAALEKTKQWLRGPSPRGEDGRLAALRDDLRSRGPFLERLAFKTGGRIRVLPVAEIEWLMAEANYVDVHVDGGSFLVRETLGGLESRLDPRHFLRIHRSMIVRIDAIAELEPTPHGDYVIVLASGARLESGRSHRHRIRAALGLDG